MKNQLTERWRLIATIALTGLLLAKSLVFFSAFLFSPRYISDEIYYVSAGKYFMYRFGVLPEFKPPVSVVALTINGTTVFRCTPLESEAIGITICALSYNWANIEHPALGKIIYGALICLLRNLILLRMAVLTFSSITFAFFFYTLISRYGLMGVVSIAVFLLLDGAVHHFTYLIFLDTLMLAFLILSVTMLLKGNRLATIPLALAAASKEVAIIFAIPFSLTFLLRRERALALTCFLAMAAALALSFALNLIAASPSQIIEMVIGMGRIVDPYACKYACLLSLREEWGMITLYPALLWLWFIGAAVKMRERYGRDIWLLPYFVSLTNIAFVVLISLIRSVYIFYYLPALALSPVVIADIADALWRNLSKGVKGQ